MTPHKLWADIASTVKSLFQAWLDYCKQTLVFDCYGISELEAIENATRALHTHATSWRWIGPFSPAPGGIEAEKAVQNAYATLKLMGCPLGVIEEWGVELDPRDQSVVEALKVLLVQVNRVVEILGPEVIITQDVPAADAEKLRGSQATRPGRAELSKETRALALLAQHPKWTDTQIAAAVPCNRTTLYKWPMYKAARKTLKQGRWEKPRGTKDGDGNLEAWQ